MTQEQEEFEKFVHRTNGTWADKCLSRGPDGRYNVLQTWSDWIAWQACWEARDRLANPPQAHMGEMSIIRKDFLDDFGYDGYDEEDVKELKKYTLELEKEILQSKGRQND